MIPWGAFDSSQSYQPDFQIELNEHNLFYYIPVGVSQLDRGLDSPMLELAHERQFAVSQLGQTSQTFESEHTARIDTALNGLFHHFSRHSTTVQRRASSPHTEDLVGLGSPGIDPPTPPTSLEIVPDTSSLVNEKSRTSSICTKSSGTTTPPLAIKDLIHPTSEEDGESASPETPYTFGEAIEPDTDHQFYDLLTYKAAARTVWTSQLSRHGQSTRTARAQKDKRMRRQSKLRSSLPADDKLCNKKIKVENGSPSQPANLPKTSSMELD